ncbi:unnamed protein product [Pleuronectes platessa]|uniref:Uncharacterized protein n=1 Tax=Pleuronectes platessa TaxID=8262 RepID=A0A9N7UCH2_PLEPL|nr:unnamed protein product [Pleuronectes platessa]
MIKKNQQSARRAFRRDTSPNLILDTYAAIFDIPGQSLDNRGMEQRCFVVSAKQQPLPVTADPNHCLIRSVISDQKHGQQPGQKTNNWPTPGAVMENTNTRPRVSDRRAPSGAQL